MFPEWVVGGQSERYSTGLVCKQKTLQATCGLTKGTKQLVEVTGLPFFGEGDIQDMVSFGLHCKEGQEVSGGQQQQVKWRSSFSRLCDVRFDINH